MSTIPKQDVAHTHGEDPDTLEDQLESGGEPEEDEPVDAAHAA